MTQNSVNAPCFSKAELAVNLNLVLQTKLRDDFYNPHADASRYSVVVFMNNEYHDADGFNIYRPTIANERIIGLLATSYK